MNLCRSPFLGKAACDECNCGGSEWYIIVISLVSGLITGMFLTCIVSYSRRKWFRNKTLEPNPEAQIPAADSIYEELDLTKMNTEQDYQALTVNAARSDGANR